ncbi:MAG: LUD domain-containing protein [Bacteroides sp.]|nr:LUD domain-containing protein [Bacteroides sp.]
MSSREEILANIRKNTQKKYDYPTWEVNGIVYPDIITKFCEINRFVGGDAIVLGKGEDIDSVIRARFPEAKRIASTMEGLSCVTLNPDTLDTPQELNGTDVAIIQGEWGVAENGMVWIPQTVKHKALYFIAESLVIVLDRNRLVNNMHEAYKKIKDDKYKFGVFISGPSKTADIEQALVMGAHGARTALVILK